MCVLLTEMLIEALPCNPSPVFPKRMVFIRYLSIFTVSTCSSRVIKRKRRVHNFLLVGLILFRFVM